MGSAVVSTTDAVIASNLLFLPCSPPTTLLLAIMCDQHQRSATQVNTEVALSIALMFLIRKLIYVIGLVLLASNRDKGPGRITLAATVSIPLNRAAIIKQGPMVELLHMF